MRLKNIKIIAVIPVPLNLNTKFAKFQIILKFIDK